MSILSSSPTSALPADATTPARRPGLLAAYLELTKARLSAMVLASTAVGFIVASGAAIDWPRLLLTIVGTGLAAASASMLNQVLEIRLDARMARTRNRPLPAGDISPAHGLIAALLCAHAGVTLLALSVNLLAATLAVITILVYVLLYTPLKTRSTFNTLIGAVCGAIPPMIGWAAATDGLGIGAWVLGAILFVWQLPHFLSLAWLYRADYERGGFAMLPVLDVSGALTSRVVLLTSLILIPLGLVVTLSGVAGWWFAIGSVALGAGLVRLTMRLYNDHSDSNARRVFLASLAYLSLLMCLLVLDRGPVGVGTPSLTRDPGHPALAAETVVEPATASFLPLLPGR